MTYAPPSARALAPFFLVSLVIVNALLVESDTLLQRVFRVKRHEKEFSSREERFATGGKMCDYRTKASTIEYRKPAP